MKTAGRIISTAAFLEGRYAEDSPMYGPERRGAPVISFVRVSDEPVEGRGPITHPDAVVLADLTVFDSEVFPALDGVEEGAVVIANASPRGPVSGLPPGTVYLNVSEISDRFLNKGSVSAGIAATACKVLGVASLRSLQQAVKMEMEEIGLDDESVQNNLKAASDCFSLAPRAAPARRQGENEEVALVELGSPTSTLASIALIKRTGNSSLNRTGAWRISEPVIDYARCTKCMICYVYCPDSSITLDADLTPRINYDNCKGCMICAEECPLKAISEEKASNIA